MKYTTPSSTLKMDKVGLVTTTKLLPFDEALKILADIIVNKYVQNLMDMVNVAPPPVKQSTSGRNMTDNATEEPK